MSGLSRKVPPGREEERVPGRERDELVWVHRERGPDWKSATLKTESCL